MFRPTHLCCRHVRSYLNSTLAILRQRFRPSQRVTIRCLNPLPNNLSFSTSDFIEERQTQHQVRIEAVPPLYKALQDSRHEKGGSALQRSTKGVHDTLCSYEDGKRLLSKKWTFSTRKKNGSDRPTTIGFNAINARLHKLGLDVRPENILYGMQSMYENPAALKQYLGKLQLPKADDSLAVSYFGGFFRYIAPRLRKTQQRQFLTRSERIYDQQWLNVITGLPDNESIQNNAPREQSLYNLGPGLDFRHWGQYINAVRRILGPETAYLEFRRSKNQHAGQSALCESDSNFINWFLNPTILHLANGDDPKHAWELAQELENPSKDLQPRTWKALLAYPDYVRIWIPRMLPWLNVSKLESLDEQVMEASAPGKLEHELSRLEIDMGLVWSGGEDGYHTIATNSSFLPGLTVHAID